jgi:hypothetical protein
MLTSGLTILMLAVSAEPGGSQPNRPMAIFEPYVGDWSCTEKIGGSPARVSDFHFDLDHQLLRETIFVPNSPSQPEGAATSAVFGFDAKSGRYAEIEMISGARWYASTANMPDDGVFHWVDAATSETASRWDMTLPKEGAFIIVSYSHPHDMTPSYRAVCKRKSQ